LLVSALAVYAAPAVAQETRTPAVWYRAAAECPSGQDFIAKLAATTAQAHLATGGEHIDFVVTLLTTPSETVGRLERQTNGGTAAIRELRDATCERVADALAMSLGLAMDPAPPASEPEAAAAPAAPLLPPADSSTPSTLPVTPVAAARVASVPPPRERAATNATPNRFVGLDFGFLSGLSTQPMARGSVFFEVDRALNALAQDVAFRVAAAASLGTADTPVGPVKRWVLSGRGEVCPWRWGTRRMALRPCLAFELGATSASSEGPPVVADHGLWAAPGLGLRGSFDVLPRLRVELGGSALLPLLREQVFIGSKPVFQDALLAFQGTVGVSAALP
jgi:hypothetical protein